MHRTSAPCKPSTNGQAERVVQILKSAIKQAQATQMDVSAVIARYLLVFRNTPHSTTGEPPSLRLMGRRLRTRLDLLTPSVEKHVGARQYTTIISRTAKRGLRQFNAGDPVLARSYGRGEKWMQGVITEFLGSRHYVVDVSGSLWKRHVDQLLSRPVGVVPSTYDSVIDQLPEMPSRMDTSGADDLPSMSGEIPLAGSCQPFPVDSRTLRVSKPHSDLDTAMTTLPSSQLDSPETVTGDDTFRAHSNSSCDISVPTNMEKRYPTRTNRGPTIYLRDYGLK